MSVVPKFKFSVAELVKQGRVDEDDLRKLSEWVSSEEILKAGVIPACGDQMMSLFLIACNNNLEDTKKCISAYYTCKKDGPELFDDRDMSREDMRQQMETLEYVVMPNRTKEGHVVLLHRLVNMFPSAYQMEVAIKLLYMTLDVACYSDPPTGLIVLFDMRGVGLRHLTRVKLGAVRKFFTYVQEALTLKLEAIHVLNCVWFMDKVMSIIRPFFNPDLIDKLHFHKSDVDMETFYENCIPKSCLPSDLGGELGTSQELHLQTWKQMEEMQEFFDQEEKMRHALVS